MAEVLTNEEIDAQIAADEARRVANNHLASQGVPGYSAMPPQMSSASTPPPTAPPTSSTWDKAVAGAKQGVAQTAGMLIGGPAGAFAAGAATRPQASHPSSTSPAPEPPTAPSTPSGGGTSPAEEEPLIINRQGGGGGVVIPGGMYPESMTTQVHEGRAAPDESKAAFAGSTLSQLEGAQKQRDADRHYYEQMRDLQATRMRATDDAMAQHARVQAERDALVKKRLAEVETLNAQASAEIDPNKFWKDRGAGAAALGAIFIGLGQFGASRRGGQNAALNIIESGINQEIQAQIQNRQIAGQKAGRAQTLLDLHLSRLGDKDKAIDATKLALYDNVLQQMEAYKADHAATMSEANYLNMKAGILERRGETANKLHLQETDDVNKQATQRYHSPQVIGGVGGGLKGHEETDTIVIPPFSGSGEAKRVSIKNPAVAGELHKIADMTAQVHRINRRASELIGKLNSVPLTDIANRREIAKELNSLADEKAALGSVKLQQGVLKESEYFRSLVNTGGFRGDDKLMHMSAPERQRIQRFLRNQDVQSYRQLTGAVKSAGGSEVAHKFERMPDGTMRKIQLEKGKLFEPDPIPPQAEKIE